MPQQKLVEEAYSYPLISIVLPTHNSASTLKPVLESILALKYPKERLELIVIDDSRDGTMTLLKEFASKYSKLFYSIKIMHYEERMGVSRARNLGIKHAVGEYIFFLDSDVVLRHDTLTDLIRILQECSKCGAVTALYIHENPPLIEKLIAIRYLGRVREGPLATGAVLIPINVIKNVGFFNEKLGYPYTVYEDWEYQVRIQKLGLKVLVDGRKPLLHISRSTQQINEYNRKNSLISKLKHYIKSLTSYLYPSKAYALYMVLKKAPWRLKVEYLFYSILLIATLLLLALGLLAHLIKFWLLVIISSFLYYIIDLGPQHTHYAILLAVATLTSRAFRAISLVLHLIVSRTLKVAKVITRKI